jgi:hypothetical protein
LVTLSGSPATGAPAIKLDLVNQASEVKAELAHLEMNPHVTGCPLNGRMDDVEDFVIAETARKSRTASG